MQERLTLVVMQKKLIHRSSIWVSSNASRMPSLKETPEK